MKDKITDLVVGQLAIIANKAPEDLRNNLGWNLSEDLNMTSVQLYPLISSLEDELDVELPFYEFVNQAETISAAIDYVDGVAAAK